MLHAGALQGSSTDQRSFPRQIPGCYDELCNRYARVIAPIFTRLASQDFQLIDTAKPNVSVSAYQNMAALSPDKCITLILSCAVTKTYSLYTNSVIYHRFTQEELLAIDLEGRCVITDHESFILFNLYGPAITSEENAADRFAYKMRLYQVSDCTRL